MAYDDGKLHPGFNSIAPVIRDAEKRLIAGIGVVGPSLRLTQAVMKEMAPDVKLCTMEISMDVGYREKKG